MEALTFDVMDLITIAGLVLSVAAGYFKLKHDRDSMQKEIKDLKTKHKEDTDLSKTEVEKAEIRMKDELTAAAMSRKSMRKETKEASAHSEDISNKRIDALRDALNKETDKNAVEFSAINTKLSDISGQLGEIKGLIQKG